MFSTLDLMLIAAVSAQCILMAYLRNPFAKSLMLLVPVPVGFGILSVGRPLDVTNACGLLLSMGFTLTVLVLYRKHRVPILLAIATGALGYCALAAVLAAWLPRTAVAFWGVLAMVLAAASGVLWAMPPREEEGYISPLSVWLKTSIVVAVIAGLVLIKKDLQGFMTTFPMLGVVASWETRHSLYTTSRQIPISCAAFAVMFGLCHVLQDRIGLRMALLGGVLVYGVLVALINLGAHVAHGHAPCAPRIGSRRRPS